LKRQIADVCIGVFESVPPSSPPPRRKAPYSTVLYSFYHKSAGGPDTFLKELPLKIPKAEHNIGF